MGPPLDTLNGNARNARLIRLAMGVVLLGGLAVRLWEYFGNASLWVDELALSENILHRSLPELLVRGLTLGQSAPPGFLAAVKISTFLFGTSELALRLPSLFFTLAALALFAGVARRYLSGWTAVFATGLFAFGFPFVHYGSELKQYAGDVAVALLLLWLGFDLSRKAPPRRAYVRAAVAGAIGAWFSMPSAFMLAGVGAALLVHSLWVPPRRPSRALLVTVALWAVSAAASGLWNITRPDPATRAFLYAYWGESFPPIPFRRRGDVLWPVNQLFLFYRWTMGYRLPLLCALLTLFGFVMLWRRRWISALLLAAPIVFTVACSAARLYPFKSRLILFLAPALMIAAAEGARWIVRGLARLRIPKPLAAAFLALPAFFAFVDNHPVFRRQENRPLFQYLAKRRRPDDAIFIPYDTIRALRYYGPRTGLDPASVTPGQCHRGDLSAYLREIDRYRGRPRVWVVFAQTVPDTMEQPAMRGYLQTIGRRREGLTVPTLDSTAFDMRTELYDLSDPARLAASTADSYPLPAVNAETVRRLSCWPEPR
ncbi:MAG TPA: glycosyltransferase family 39 protein [Thermoanaerobaculia bacterium]